MLPSPNAKCTQKNGAKLKFRTLYSALSPPPLFISLLFCLSPLFPRLSALCPYLCLFLFLPSSLSHSLLSLSPLSLHCLGLSLSPSSPLSPLSISVSALSHYVSLSLTLSLSRLSLFLFSTLSLSLSLSVPLPQHSMPPNSKSKLSSIDF